MQFLCETGAIWMENCNECRCQRNNHVVCAHLACLRNSPAKLVAETPAVEEPPAAALVSSAAAAPGNKERDMPCYLGKCPQECDSRLDETGCHICDCGEVDGDVTAMVAPPSGQKRRWSFLTVARSLRNKP